MAVVELKYKDEGKRYLGLSSDAKPTGAEVPENSIFEELDTGAIYKWGGDSWVWFAAARELDHNRMELGRGNSYQVETEQTIPSGQALVVRFRPGAVIYHHAEKRGTKTEQSTCRLSIYRITDPAELPALVATAVNINQKGLTAGGSLALFDNHGFITSAALTALIANGTEGIRLDGDTIFGDSSFLGGDTAGASPVISGRHYLPNDDLLLVAENVGGTDTTFTYKYNWHEGQ